MIQLRVLGPVELRDSEGRELRSVLAQPKRLALLVALVVGPRGFRRRDSLLALLWPELDQTRARVALNQAVHFLRRELSGSVILSRGADELGIDQNAIWCDVMAFQDHMEAGRFNDALELYRGALLTGFFTEQGAGFDDWLERERELVRSAAARAARSLAGLHERDRNFTPAVAAARRAMELSDADERVMRELLQLLDRLGDRAGALQAYDRFAKRLADDFDAQPAVETRLLIDQIRARAEPVAHAEPSSPEAAGNGTGPRVAVVDGVPRVAEPVPLAITDAPAPTVRDSSPTGRRVDYAVVAFSGGFGILLGAAVTWLLLR